MVFALVAVRAPAHPTTVQDHPGGTKIILKYAGKDATSAYEPIHPPDALDKNLPPEKHLGELDSLAASAVKEAAQNRKKTKDELRVEAAHKVKPPLSRVLSLWDIEVCDYQKYTAIQMMLSSSMTRILHIRSFHIRRGRTTRRRPTRSSVGLVC